MATKRVKLLHEASQVGETMKKRASAWWLILVIGLSVVLVAACGDSSSSDSPPTARTTSSSVYTRIPDFSTLIERLSSERMDSVSSFRYLEKLPSSPEKIQAIKMYEITRIAFNSWIDRFIVEIQDSKSYSQPSSSDGDEINDIFNKSEYFRYYVDYRVPDGSPSSGSKLGGIGSGIGDIVAVAVPELLNDAWNDYMKNKDEVREKDIQMIGCEKWPTDTWLLQHEGQDSLCSTSGR